MIPFYITLYINHPWENNFQYKIHCSGWDEARRSAIILSAYEDAYVMLSDTPGFKKEGEIFRGRRVVEGNIKTLTKY